jgi:hypothetical protein
VQRLHCTLPLAAINHQRDVHLRTAAAAVVVKAHAMAAQAQQPRTLGAPWLIMDTLMPFWHLDCAQQPNVTKVTCSAINQHNLNQQQHNIK